MPSKANQNNAIPKPFANNVRLSEDYLLRTLNVSRVQLRAWQRAGWIAPSAALSEVERRSARSAQAAREYSSADLLTLKTLLRLRKGGVPLNRLRGIHDALKKRFDALGVRRPFSELHLRGEDKRVLVTFRGTRMEPLTGQLMLDYPGADSGGTVQIPFTLPPGGHSQRRAEADDERLRRAERFFMAALRQEAQPGGLSKAIRAYRRAIELNPQAMGALLNLGTLYYNQGKFAEAGQCYQGALEVNPRSALAHFNMGNLADETGQPLKAVDHYEQAIQLDDRYPDPRYNLALVYEKLGRHGQAWKNWRAYLKLDPDSRWADLARNRLAQQQWKVIPSSRTAERARQPEI